MKCLAVNTATKVLSIAIVEGDRVLHAFSSPEMRDQGNLLMGHIQSGLQAAGLDFADLDVLGVVTGPGSFTGIRIGLAAMRGIALAADKPIIGFSSFDMFAAGGHEDEAQIVAVESWREELYFAALDGEGHPLVECLNEKPALFAARCHHALLKDMPVRITGDAKEAVAGFFPGAVLAQKDGDAADVAHLALRKFKKGGEFARPLPYYLREADVTISAKLPRRLEAKQ